MLTLAPGTGPGIAATQRADAAEAAFVPAARPDRQDAFAQIAAGAVPAAAAAAPGGTLPGTQASSADAQPAENALAAVPPKPAFGRRMASSLDGLIAKYADHYDVPEALVRRVVQRESRFNPAAYNNGHWGLMQIKHQTARGMGYRGEAKGLLDAETNLKYAVKYLRGALLVAEGNHDRADRFYQTGYYYDAKRMGLLDETGLGRDRVRKRKGG